MDLGDFTQTVELTFPCLITVDKDICEPRLPSYRKKIATRDRPIQTLTFFGFTRSKSGSLRFGRFRDSGDESFSSGTS